MSPTNSNSCRSFFHQGNSNIQLTEYKPCRNLCVSKYIASLHSLQHAIVSRSISLSVFFIQQYPEINSQSGSSMLPIKLLYFQKWGCNTVAIFYRKWGLTTGVYSCFNKDISKWVNELISPRTWLALLTAPTTWQENLSLVSIHTLRSFSTSTTCKR